MIGSPGEPGVPASARLVKGAIGTKRGRGGKRNEAAGPGGGGGRSGPRF